MLADGGGEKNGMEGIVVGKVGSEGMFGVGGKVTCGLMVWWASWEVEAAVWNWALMAEWLAMAV